MNLRMHSHSPHLHFPRAGPLQTWDWSADILQEVWLPSWPGGERCFSDVMIRDVTLCDFKCDLITTFTIILPHDTILSHYLLSEHWHWSPLLSSRQTQAPHFRSPKPEHIDTSGSSVVLCRRDWFTTIHIYHTILRVLYCTDQDKWSNILNIAHRDMSQQNDRLS